MKKITFEPTEPAITPIELIDVIKAALEKDERIKRSVKFGLNKALQIESTSGDFYNIRVHKLSIGDSILERTHSIEDFSFLSK